jgi:hypothetical protein
MYENRTVNSVKTVLRRRRMVEERDRWGEFNLGTLYACIKILQ